MNSPIATAMCNLKDHPDCPKVGDTAIYPKLIDGTLVAVDKDGYVIKNLVSAELNSDMKNMTKLTITVNVAHGQE